MSQADFPLHFRSSEYADRRGDEALRTINAAVQLLGQQNEVGRAAAYMILVGASVDLRMSISETADQLLHEAAGPGAA